MIYPVLRAKIHRFARFRADWLDCDEITDAVIERLWERVRGRGPAVRELEAMAIAIASNVVKDAIKKKRPVYTDDIASVTTGFDLLGTAGDQEGRLDLRDAIEALEPALKESLKLVHIDELSMVQAAAVLGVGRGVVRRRVDRALAELRRLLEDRPPGHGPSLPRK
ncbi:RNA polymerase sigma factor [Amycolatopsis sp. cmx-8-4]|uniref:RNA polymerase sigma factor n=1 Tax=Amycolatopsis sp. cmx-8-4 TaxID=2790947 RepID=UPI00397ADFD9